MAECWVTSGNLLVAGFARARAAGSWSSPQGSGRAGGMPNHEKRADQVRRRTEGLIAIRLRYLLKHLLRELRPHLASARCEEGVSAMAHAEFQGSPVHHETWDTGLPVVALHGGGSSGAQWQRLVAVPPPSEGGRQSPAGDSTRPVYLGVLPS